MPPRRASSPMENGGASGGTSGGTTGVSTTAAPSIDEIERNHSLSNERRLVFPQHLQQMVQSATKVTIVSDNAKVPPLPLWSPILREQRGLPPFTPLGTTQRTEKTQAPPRGGTGGTTTGTSTTNTNPRSRDRSNTQRKKSESSRWESMPPPKRLNDDFNTYPVLAMLRQGAYHTVAVGIPLLPTPNPPSGSAAGHNNNSTNTSNQPPAANNNNNNTNSMEQRSSTPGLIIPRRRDSFDQSKNMPNKDFLAQVLASLDLSDDEVSEGGENHNDDAKNNVSQWITKEGGGLPPPGRFHVASHRQGSNPTSLLASSSLAQLPPPVFQRQNSDSPSIPVRRRSVDSTELEGLADLFGSEDEEDDSENLDISEEDDDDNGELLLYEDTSDDDSCENNNDGDDEEEEEEEDRTATMQDQCLTSQRHDTSKDDDGTLATATTASTLSTYRGGGSTNAAHRDMGR